ncbi:1-acyl-sn-glycerol-3-phosphate acyltransferase [Catalinimonas alkaloidigena]|uniref:1-acyl-sn-glycerol-3-phosphate acyltransferase n=1 Tax=Catalinimonas alkaloidigena TaxID=1075417 RepID=A0A1G9GYD4_9BACT|nr:lysophospholipid acyltransferase family protein [Catalinimonas alkaloidigena]SDL05681.1 1-acyl-sn-glycerol-3-phosphate acyltransferase [Catalinimonas alkaloidigena]
MRKLYRAWSLFWFAFFYTLLFPWFWLFLRRKAWFRYTGPLNRIWAHLFYAFSFFPIRVERRFRVKKGEQYIFCPNHASYLDIPTTGYALPGYITYMGKSSLARVPLFGYMFKKLHITVDRKSRMGRYRSLIAAREALERGSHLVIFPEGGIPDHPMPALAPFKDGPFRLALEKQLPIVPVTIPYNWIILPDDGKFLPRRHPGKVILHEPIVTQGMTIEHLEELKQRTYEVIYQEMVRHFPDQMSPRLRPVGEFDGKS